MATVNTKAVLKKIFEVRLKASYGNITVPDGFNNNDLYIYKEKSYPSIDTFISAMAEDLISNEDNFAVIEVKSELEMIDSILDTAQDLAKSIREQKLKLATIMTKMKTDFAAENGKLAVKMGTDVAQYSIPLVTASAVGPGTAIALPLAKGITNLYQGLMGIYTDMSKTLSDIVDNLEPSFDDQKDLISGLLDSAKSKIESFGIDVKFFSFINAKFTSIELLLK